MITSVSSTIFPTQRNGWMTSPSSSSSPSRVRPQIFRSPVWKLTDFTGWKRLLLADGPRQSINALTLYAFYLSKKGKDNDWWNISKYFAGGDFSTNALTVTTAFTVVVFAGSLLLLIAAGICYIPLLCHIQGNLKEYCCHKVDKVRSSTTLNSMPLGNNGYVAHRRDHQTQEQAAFGKGCCYRQEGSSWRLLSS